MKAKKPDPSPGPFALYTPDPAGGHVSGGVRYRVSWLYADGGPARADDADLAAFAIQQARGVRGASAPPAFPIADTGQADAVNWTAPAAGTLGDSDGDGG